MNTVLIILLALSSVVILTFVIVMLVRGRKTRHEVEDLVYSQLRSIKNNVIICNMSLVLI